MPRAAAVASTAERAREMVESFIFEPSRLDIHSTDTWSLSK